MKRWSVAVAIVAALAIAATQRVDTDVTVHTEVWTIANNLATNAALLTTDGTEPKGVGLLHGGGVGACISAPSGQTITAGTMRAYVYMPVSDTTSPPTYRWVPYSPLDWSPQTGARDACSGDRQGLSGIGRLAYVEDNVTLSGAGTTIDITYSMRSGMPR